VRAPEKKTDGGNLGRKTEDSTWSVAKWRRASLNGFGKKEKLINFSQGDPGER